MGTFEFYDVTQQLAVMEENILRRLEVDSWPDPTDESLLDGLREKADREMRE